MKPVFFCFLVLLCFLASCNSCRQQAPPPVTQNSSPVPPSSPSPQGTLSIADAQDSGAVSVRVTGVDVEKMHVEVSSTRPGTIVIPVGTVFASGSADTQTMISAATVRVVFAGTGTYALPQIQSIDLEVYCINRFLDAPTAQSSFVVTRGGRELDPVRRLAACLEGKSDDHYARQLAIWMTSDHFIEMTDDQVREKLLNHAVDLMTSDQGIKELSRAIPNLSEDQLREIRDTPEFRKVVVDAAAKEIEKEVDAYKTKARGLLEQCNFDLSTSKFFQS